MKVSPMTMNAVLIASAIISALCTVAGVWADSYSYRKLPPL